MTLEPAYSQRAAAVMTGLGGMDRVVSPHHHYCE